MCSCAVPQAPRPARAAGADQRPQPRPGRHVAVRAVGGPWGHGDSLLQQQHRQGGHWTLGTGHWALGMPHLVVPPTATHATPPFPFPHAPPTHLPAAGQVPGRHHSAAGAHQPPDRQAVQARARAAGLGAGGQRRRPGSRGQRPPARVDQPDRHPHQAVRPQPPHRLGLCRILRAHQPAPAAAQPARAGERAAAH
jgi:hypothetical protein